MQGKLNGMASIVSQKLFEKAKYLYFETLICQSHVSGSKCLTGLIS